MKKEVMQAALIGFGIAVIGITIVIIIAINSGGGSDRCKETSNTTAEYRGCIAVEKCRSDFEGNGTLIGDCIADVIIQGLR